MASTEDRTYPAGRTPKVYTAQISRTHTIASTLFTLEPGAVPISLRIINSGTAVSNAGTNARISVGSTGTNTYFLADFDVKTAGAITNVGIGQSVPSSATNLGAALAFKTHVTGIYTEAGNASSAGGPWTVLMEVLDV